MCTQGNDIDSLGTISVQEEEAGALRVNELQEAASMLADLARLEDHGISEYKYPTVMYLWS